MSTINGFCPHYFSNFEVNSRSGKTYQVHFYGLDAVCTCPAWRYSGDYGDQSCKHVQFIWTNGCFHGRPTAPGVNDLAAVGAKVLSSRTPQVNATPCPGCGEPQVSTGISGLSL